MKSQNNMTDYLFSISDFCSFYSCFHRPNFAAKSHISDYVLQQHDVVLFLRILLSAASYSSPWKLCKTGGGAACRQL